MEKVELCRLCLGNSMNVNVMPSTKTMERTMRQFNMLYSVSAAHSPRRVFQCLICRSFAESGFHC